MLKVVTLHIEIEITLQQDVKNCVDHLQAFHWCNVCVLADKPLEKPVHIVIEQIAWVAQLLHNGVILTFACKNLDKQNFIPCLHLLIIPKQFILFNLDAVSNCTSFIAAQNFTGYAIKI